jgi:hypothetical protein
LIAPIGMLFSNASIFVLAGLFVCTLFEQWKVKQMQLFLSNNILKIITIIVFLLCYYVLWLSKIEGIRSGFMNGYWQQYYIEEFTIPWVAYLLQHSLGYFIYVSYNLYLNSVLFVCLFFFGFVFLFKDFREKRYMLFAIITSIIFCFIAYFLRRYPLLSGNEVAVSWLSINCRLFVHFFPIVLIVPCFAIFKLLESIKLRKVIFLILIALSCFAFHFSYQKITYSLEIFRISELIETLEYENSAIVMEPSVANPYLYYQFLRGKSSGEIYLLFDYHYQPTSKISYFYEFSEYSIFLFPYSPFKAIFEKLKSNGKKRAYFIFTNTGTEALFHRCYLYVKNNFPSEKTFLYEERGIKAILVEFE